MIISITHVYNRKKDNTPYVSIAFLIYLSSGPLSLNEELLSLKIPDIVSIKYNYFNVVCQ